MELQAVSGVAVAKGLVGKNLTGGERLGPSGHLEASAMPLHDEKIVGNKVGALRSRLYRVKAKLYGAVLSRPYVCAEHVCQQLPAETQAQHGNLLG